MSNYAPWANNGPTPGVTWMLARRETDLSPPVKYFYWPFQGGASFMDHLCYFCLVFVMLSLMPCGHLLGKGWPLGSRLWCLIVKLSLSHWYPGSGVVLDCIDSWSLPFFLLLYREKHEKILPETIRPRALIFGMKHHQVDLYQACSNYPPGAKISPTPGVTRDMAIFQQITICKL